MKQYGKDKKILLLSVPLALLTAIASYAGVFLEDTYSRETLSYAAQGIGQDAVNLFVVVPVLLLSAFLAYRENRAALFIWSGALFYIAYSYTIYAFALHFNAFFLIYCSVLGLSFYSFLYFLHIAILTDIKFWFSERVSFIGTAVFFLAMAVIFYFLWFSEIIPSLLTGSIPPSVIESDLLINPVHVIDLSICLPALILTGILLLKKRKLGPILAPSLLSFCLLMSVAIIAMVIVMKMNELEIDIALTVIFGIIALLCIFFLVRSLGALREKNQPSIQE